MNPDLRNLIALQDLELNITSLQKQISEIPGKIQGFQNELEYIQVAHQERVARVQELSKQRRILEGEVDMMRSKLSRLKDQLMSVKTNKEYTAMLHEIQMAEEQIRKEEDKILEIMEEMETMEFGLKEAEQQLNNKSTELRENIQKVEKSKPQLEAELENLGKEKSYTESQIDADLLARYRRIAEARKGIALAEAKDELCTSCHIRIRPQVYADLLRTENIHTCDSCSRILFYRKSI